MASSMQQIQDLLDKWVEVRTLTIAQRALVIGLRDVSRKGDMREFLVFANLMRSQFEHDIIQAIEKARAEGLGVKEH